MGRAIALSVVLNNQMPLPPSPLWNKSKSAMLAIADERSPFPPLSQKRAIDLLHSTSAGSPFWLRVFLQGSAIALHVYQRPNLRSPFWNKSKSAMLGIADSRSPFPSLSQKRAIALLNSTSARSPFWLRMFLQGSAIAIPSKTKQQIDLGLYFSFSTKGDRPFLISQKIRYLNQKRAIYPPSCPPLLKGG